MHVARAAIDAARRGVGRVAHQAELGREEGILAAAAQGAAHQLLVAERTVGVRGVEEVEPAVERVLESRKGLRIVMRAIELAHPHAA